MRSFVARWIFVQNCQHLILKLPKSVQNGLRVFIRFLSHYYASCSEKCISNSVTDYILQQCEWSVTERGAADVFRLSPERYFYHFLRYCQKRDRDRYTTDDKRTCGIGVQTKHIFSRPHSCSCSKLKLLDQPTFTLNKVHLYRYLFMFPRTSSFQTR